MLLFPPRPEDFKFSEAKSPRLRIVSYSDAVRTIIVRGITKTGLIHDTYVTTSNRLVQTRIIALTEIPLTVLIETSTTGVQRGQLYVQTFLEFAGVPAAVLAADYITTGSPLTWPGGIIKSSTEGRGNISFYLLDNPNTGSNFVFNIPPSTLFHFLGLTARFATSVEEITRTFRIATKTSTNVPISFSVPNATQLLNTQRTYHFFNYNVIPAPFDLRIFGHLPPIFLPGGSIICSVIDGLDASDFISDLYIYFEQWLNP